MADKIILGQIDIDMDKAIADAQALKQTMGVLTDEMKKAKNTTGETSKEYIEYEAALKQVKMEYTEQIKQIQRVTVETSKSKDGMQVYEKTGEGLKRRLKEINQEMLELAVAGKQDTQRFKELQTEGGALRDSIDEVRSRIKLFSSDTKSLDQVIMAFQGIGAAAQIAEGASALLGEENENLTKSIQKMVAIQGILNGLQEIQNLLQKESGFMIMANSIKTKGLAAAQTIYATAVGASTGAMKLFKIALLATGIGAIIAGIAALVLNWDKLTSSISESAKAANQYAKEMERAKRINELNSEMDEQRLRVMKELGVEGSKYTQVELENNKKKQAALEKESEALFQIGLLRERNAEEEERYNAISKELIAAKDEATLLSIRITRQQKEEQEAADNAELERQNKLAEAALARQKEKQRLAEEARKADEDAFNSFADSIESDMQESNDRMRAMIEEGNQLLTDSMQVMKDEQSRIMEEEAQREMERLQLDYENKQALLSNDIFTQLEAERIALEQKRQQEVYYANQIGADTALVNKKYDKAELALEKAKMDAKLSLASDFFGNIAQLAGEGTAVGKAAALAETTINTFKAATGAFSSLAPIPIVGPALGAAAAAAAVASGIANARKIVAVKSGLPGDSSGGGSSISASSPVTATPTYNTTTTTASQTSIGNGIVSRATGGESSGLATTEKILVVDDVTAKQKTQSEIIRNANL